MRLHRPAQRTILATLVVMSSVVAALGFSLNASAATPTELFVSEYIEGTSNNKAIELFNGTGAAVDLAAGGYLVQMYFNGAATANTAITLTGTVADGDVFVLAHASANATVLAQADQTSTASFYNGDDAIVLRKGGADGPILDVIGQVGVDPGTEWGTGVTSTADNTLRRAPGVVAGDTDGTDAFDPAAQWVGYATDTFDGLGGHSIDGGATPTPTGSATESPTPSPSPSPSPTATVRTVGEVQGSTLDSESGRLDRSPFAPASGTGTSSAYYDVRGVITQRTLARTSSGGSQYGFFLQSRLGATDNDPSSSDGIFVFMGSYTSLIGGYVPTVGDEVVLHARVSEYYYYTELSGASLVTLLATGLDVNTEVAVTDATPPADSAAADLFWERHESMRLRVRAGSVATSGRDVFSGTADAELWLVDRDDPLLARTDPYARRVFRDSHPLDNQATPLFDDGNGNRIMLASLGLKWATGDSTTLLPPARIFDTLSQDAIGGLYYSYEKYGVQAEAVSFDAGVDPALNAAPQAADRAAEFSVATFNMENLYDYRDDPFDGCDFTGNAGCTGVSPPFDYVPASEAAYADRLGVIANQVINNLQAPDLILAQEAEDQDICTVTGGALGCGETDNADGAPDTLQELALAIIAAGGPEYAAAYDRDGRDARGITAAFLYRTDRLSLAAPGTGVLGADPGVTYRATGLGYNADAQNPKALNAVLPSDVDTSTGVDGANVFTRAPQVARFTVAAKPGSTEGFTLWAVSNHYSSGPDARVGQRREQAAYGAAIVSAITTAEPGARVVYGGDLNVYPRPDDPIARSDSDTPSDQLAPLYTAGLHNLWDNLVAEAPSAAYSYVYQGQAQTLDHLFVTDSLYGDLVRMRAAHVNAGYPADYDGDGPRGASDHDPQVARFRSQPIMSVADASVVEGDSGSTPLTFTIKVSRPLSAPAVVCATAVGRTAWLLLDFTPILTCQTLAVGATSVTVGVPVRGDRIKESDETLSLIVVGAPYLTPNPVIATGTIINND